MITAGFSIPRPLNPLVGRAKELAEMRTWISSPSSSNRLLVLTGIGGIGKTALAARFAADEANLGRSVAWLGTRSADGSAGWSSEQAEQVFQETVREALDGLRSPSLLVLDDEQNVDRIHFVASSNAVPLLVTSRDQRLASLGRGLVVNSLTRRASITVIRRQMPEMKLTDAHRLVDRLQGHPLALHIAVSGLKHSRLSVEEYLAALDERTPDDIRAQGRVQISQSAAAVARRDYRRGLKYLKDGRYGEAVAHLTRASSGLHSALGSLSPDTLEASLSLGEALQLSGRIDESVAVLSEVASRGETSTAGRASSVDLRVRSALASALRASGRNHEALQLMQSLMPEMHETLGANHPDTLEAMSSLAVMYDDLGDSEAARELLDEVVERSQTFSSREFAALRLAARANLAALLTETGDLERATALFESIVDDHEQIFGPDHPETLSAYGQLAMTLWRRGEAEAAADLELRVVQGRRRILGPDHPDTLAAMRNLGISLMDLGRNEDGLKQLRQAADGYRSLAASNAGMSRTLGLTLMTAGLAAASSDITLAVSSLYEAYQVFRDSRAQKRSEKDGSDLATAALVELNRVERAAGLDETKSEAS